MSARLTLLFCLLVVPALPCYAQHLELVDSLEALLQGRLSPQQEIEVCNTLAQEYTYGFAFLFTQEDSALSMGYANRALNLARQQGSAKGEAEALAHMGLVCMLRKHHGLAQDYFNQVNMRCQGQANCGRALAKATYGQGRSLFYQGEITDALLYLQRAERESEAIEEGAYLAGECMLWQGYCYNRLGQGAMANQVMNKAITLFALQGQLFGVSKAYISLASSYSIQANKAKAFQFYDLAIEYAMAAKDSVHWANSLRAMARFYDGIGENQKAIATYEKVLKVLPAKNKFFRRYYSLDLGYFYLQAGEVQKALPLLQDYLAQNKALGRHENLNMGLRILGEAYYELGRYETALAYLDSAFVKGQEYPLYANQRKTCLFLAKAHLARQNIPQASAYAVKTFEIAKQAGIWDDAQAASRILAQTNALEGNYQKAYQWQVLHLQYADSASTRELARQIFEIEGQKAVAAYIDSLELYTTLPQTSPTGRPQPIATAWFWAGLGVLALLGLWLGWAFYTQGRAHG